MSMTEDTRTALLQAYLAGQGPGGGASTEDLLAQLGASDPTAAMIAQYLAQRRAADLARDELEEGDDEPSGPDPELIRQVQERAEAQEAALRRLRRKVDVVYAELEELRTRNEDLAAALGACARCWGDDPACPICEGSGPPGGAPPDPYLFSRLVGPALRRLRHRHSSVDPAGVDPLVVEPTNAR